VIPEPPGGRRSWPRNFERNPRISRRGYPGSSGDIGGPTRNIVIAWPADARAFEAACRKPFRCVFPDILRQNLGPRSRPPRHAVYRKARAIFKGIKRGSWPRECAYALARAVRRSGIPRASAAPHRRAILKNRRRSTTEDGPLVHMMKARIGGVRSVKALLRPLLAGGGKEAVPDPRPSSPRTRGTTDEDMLNSRCRAQRQRVCPRFKCRRSCPRDGRGATRCYTRRLIR